MRREPGGDRLERAGDLEHGLPGAGEGAACPPELDQRPLEPFLGSGELRQRPLRLLVVRIELTVNFHPEAITFAQPFDLGKAISGLSVSAGGQVVFSIDGVMQSVSLDGSGNATLTTSALAVGNHPISASYSGDTNFNPNTAKPLVQVVNP